MVESVKNPLDKYIVYLQYEGYYYLDETGDLNGPYETIHIARKRLQQYIDFLEGRLDNQDKE